MRLLHYTEEPLAYDPARTYEQSEPRSFGKPSGMERVREFGGK